MKKDKSSFHARLVAACGLIGGISPLVLLNRQKREHREVAANNLAGPVDVDGFRRALDSLPAMPREVYRLHRIEGLGFAEVAERLGLSPHEVEAMMAKALRGLHAAIHGGAR